MEVLVTAQDKEPKGNQETLKTSVSQNNDTKDIKTNRSTENDDIAAEGDPENDDIITGNTELDQNLPEEEAIEKLVQRILDEYARTSRKRK